MKLFSPAKLNLTLAVGAPRPDGFHPIASLMVTLADFGDTVHLTRSNHPCDPCYNWHKDAPDDSEPLDFPLKDDLCHRAHQLLARHVGRELPAYIEIEKNIPVGGGLAGGSSNAAAVLVGLNQLFELNLPDTELIQLATQLGSDTAFLTHTLLSPTQPAALCTGRGEQLAPAALNLPQTQLILVFPGGPSHTGKVYQRFDQRAQFDDVDARQADCLAVAAGKAPPFNSLTQAAQACHPQLKHICDVAHRLGHTIHVTGSGSTAFILCETEDADTNLDLCDELEATLDVPCRLTSITL